MTWEDEEYSSEESRYEKFHDEDYDDDDFNWGLVAFPYFLIPFILGIIIWVKYPDLTFYLAATDAHFPIGLFIVVIGGLLLLCPINKLREGGEVIPEEGKRYFIIGIVIDVVLTIITSII